MALFIKEMANELMHFNFNAQQSLNDLLNQINSLNQKTLRFLLIIYHINLLKNDLKNLIKIFINLIIIILIFFS